MWLKNIIVDGFKSYANRTVISGWDPSFNAITGLNGSGKSNILDAICFVLGISNLSQVRAKSLQELVYKQGQARVTKASVTVVFDNADKKMSPVGYEQYDEITITRQVVIGGRNKYLINGHAAQASKVQNLFLSVQLNVNNPHFLIMQGRITKVVNMKPPEVLSLIEEASGTRMYETKKNSAIKTIQKKQSKVDEINKILVEEITPTLDRLRAERSTYMQWSSNNNEIAQLERYDIAYSFYAAEELLQTAKTEILTIENSKKELETKIEELNEELTEKTKTIEQLTKQKEKEMQTEFKGLEKEVTEKSKDLVKETSIWTNKKEALETEKKNRQQLVTNIDEVKANIQEKEKESKTVKHQSEKVQAEHKELVDKINNIQSQLLGVGVNEEKDQGTLQSQLMESQRLASEADGEAQQAELKARHIRSELKDKEKRLKSSEKEYAHMQTAITKNAQALESIEAELKLHKYDEKERQTLEQQVNQLETTYTDLRERRDRLRARFRQMQFDYSDPVPGFDRKKVKGLVAELVNVQDAKAATALEVSAGGKLYNVVVDTQETGKLLLERGRLRRRVTIIPLNQIAQRTISSHVLERAQQLVGKDNAKLALSLVGYDHEVEAAMKFVFGGTLICRDSKSAVKVTFDKDVRARSVTLEGDLFDPSGTLTGGSKPQGGGLLLLLAELNEVTTAFTKAEKELQEYQKRLAVVTKAEDAVRGLVNKKELISHELGLHEARFRQSSVGKLKEEVDSLSEQLVQLEATSKAAQEKKAKLTQKCDELERSIRDFEKERKNKLKDLEKELAQEKKKLAASTKAAKDAQQRGERVDLEANELRQELKTAEEQVAKLQEIIDKLEEEVQQLSQSVASKKAVFDEMNQKLEKEREKMAAADKRINSLQKEKTKLSKQVADSELEVKKIAMKITRMHADSTEAKKRVESLLKKYEWIQSEKHLFGKPQTDYDFKKITSKAATARLNKLRAEQEELSKKINKKVMGMYEKAEQEYQDLVGKKDQIEKDKKKIEEVILELDRKKNEALEKTWKKVTKDFGSIFSTLLPGTQARLSPVEGKSVLDGLEMKVAFGGIWKQSLSELSGGQRSLLALSLILALLLFKPAPMYILDEIDAALDLSHTQNIGQMLKTHFPQSQFIVVSLKEGMFNNANVVFRTKVIDGVSTVRRTAMEHNKGQKSAVWPSSGALGAKKHKSSVQDKENSQQNIDEEED